MPVPLQKKITPDNGKNYFLYTIYFSIRASTSCAGEIYCFEAKQKNKNISLELTLPENSKSGFAKYKNGSGPIPIMLSSTKQQADDDSRQYEFVSTWLEKDKLNNVTGKYVVSAQGVNINSVEYIGKNKKHRVNFEPDYDATTRGKCW
jgi:hypothetical protein